MSTDENRTQSQTIEIERHAQQQSLQALRFERAPRCLHRQLALDRRKHALDEGALPIQLAWEAPPHARTETLDLPGRLAAFRWNDTACPLRTDMLMIAFTIEFAIRQHHAHRLHLHSAIHQRAQRRTIVGRTAFGDLGDQHLASDIDGDHPLDPMPPRKARWLVTSPMHEKGADGTRREPVASTAIVVRASG